MSLWKKVKHGVKSLVKSGTNAWKGFSGQASTEKMTQKQMDFQERMRDTAYQAQVLDMEKAGLNPILAYKGGGASSPSGASGTGVNNAQIIGDTASKISSSALSMMRNKKELALLDAQEKATASSGLKSMKERSILEEDLKIAKNRAKLDTLSMPAKTRAIKFENDHPNIQKTGRILQTLGLTSGVANSAKAVKALAK